MTYENETFIIWNSYWRRREFTSFAFNEILTQLIRLPDGWTFEQAANLRTMFDGGTLPEVISLDLSDYQVHRDASGFAR